MYIHVYSDGVNQEMGRAHPEKSVFIVQTIQSITCPKIMIQRKRGAHANYSASEAVIKGKRFQVSFKRGGEE